jgi:hypothetical protein
MVQMVSISKEMSHGEVGCEEGDITTDLLALFSKGKYKSKLKCHQVTTLNMVFSAT